MVFWKILQFKKILQNKLYIGDLIQNRVNYKYRKIVYNLKEQWIIVENPIDKKLLKKSKKCYFLKKDKMIRSVNIYLTDFRCGKCEHNISIRVRDKKRKRIYIKLTNSPSK